VSKIRPMTPGIPHGARVRAYLAGIVVSLGITGVAYRAYGLQVDEGDHYRELADRQHAMIVDIPAPRGEIRDAKGRPLAVSADVDSIWANPREIHDVTETAAKLGKILNLDPGVLEAKLGADKKFVWLVRHVTRDAAKAVADAKLPGIELAKEPRRWYPSQKVGGTLIGRSDIDNRGLDGVELAMDTLLTGKHTANAALRDARGHKMYADGLATAQPGATVTLSLDRSVQAIAESALAESVTANKAKSGVCVVLDVATSKIVAMASYPTYDPNTGEGLAIGARNKPVTDAFEAGSVMKVFSVAAALDAGVVTPDTVFDLSGGSFQIKGASHPIRDVHADGNLTVSGIIKRSSNVGAAKIALRFGRDGLYAALVRFGFGARTGIELPGEQHGMLRKGDTWREIELATIAFGYGLTTTPLQIATALAAIGHGGIYTTPHIVDRVTDGEGNVVFAPTSESHAIMKPETAAAMVAMLASVFDKDDKTGHGGGTAKDITVPGFKCGGKTGTAHKYDPATKQYSPDHYLSSFAGLAPIDHPRLAIVVMVDDPSGGDYYGGKVAGPVFAAVASQSLRYLGVPGDALPPPPPAPAAPAAKRKKVDASPAPVVVEAPSDLPDFKGLGVARALELAREHHLEVELAGSGRVVEQEARGPGKILLHFSDGNSPILHKTP